MRQRTGSETLERLQTEARLSKSMSFDVLDLILALREITQGQEITLSPEGLRLLVVILAERDIENLPYGEGPIPIDCDELGRIIRGAYFKKAGRNQEAIPVEFIDVHSTGESPESLRGIRAGMPLAPTFSGWTGRTEKNATRPPDYMNAFCSTSKQTPTSSGNKESN